MKKLTLALLVFITNFALQADDIVRFSSDQKGQIESIIHDYLLEHPEVIAEAVQVLQERQNAMMHEKAVKAINQESAKVFGGNSPYLGNKEGTVFIVEFLDYNCPHCRKESEVINKLINNNKDLKVIIKEFPVLGEASIFAAKAALAANKQGKFAELHNAFMNEKVLLKNSRVLEIAKEVGLNVPQLQKDMETTEPELLAVRNLAIAIGIQATPALIVSKYPIQDEKKVLYIPGAVEQSILQDAINLVR